MIEAADAHRPGRRNAVHVIQGEYAVSDDADTVLCTLLGSCVSACLRDPEAGVGGLNHFLLPEGDGSSGNLSYGVNAMELLINDLLGRGARRNRLEAGLFGGARMIRTAIDIGSQNARFARDFLHAEGIPLITGSLGGTRARRIEFWPVTGRMRQQLIDQDAGIFATERNAAPSRSTVADAGAVELF